MITLASVPPPTLTTTSYLHVEPRESSSAWPLFGISHRALPDCHRTHYHGILYVLRRRLSQICLVYLDGNNSLAPAAPLLQVRLKP